MSEIAGQPLTKREWLLSLRGYGPPVVALVFGISLSLGFSQFVQDWEADRADHSFEREAINHKTLIEQAMDHTLEAIHSIGALYAASHEVERVEFRAFASIEMEDQAGIQALEWIPRVSAAERAAYEAAAWRDGFPDFTFSERASQGHMVPAAVREEYFPVYFVEPFEGNEAAFGFDLASNPKRLEALNRARDTGEAVATARITLVQETGDQYGIIVFDPIYRSGEPADTVEERRENLTGFGLGVLRLGDLIDAALRERDVDHSYETIDMFVFDVSAPAGAQLLYPKSASAGRREDVVLERCVDTPIEVGGRDWLIAQCPASEVWAPQHWQSWAALLAGLAVTGMLVVYLVLMLRQSARMERLTEGLRESEDRYRGLFDNAHDMIQSIDTDGRFVFVNAAWLDTMGYTWEEIKDLNIFDLIAPSSKPHCMEVFERVTAGEPQDNVPVTFVRKDGEYVETEGNITPRKVDGRIVSTQGIFRDITERRLHEQRERTAGIEQERIAAELTQLIDTANAPIFGVDTDGRVNEWNQMAAKITGYGKDEVMGRDLVGEFITDDYKAPVKRVLDKALAGEETANFEFPLFTKSGERVDILLNSTTRRDVSGNIIGMIGIGQDITERRRTEDLLRQAQKMEAVGQLTGGIAHDFNNYLTSILGNLQLIAEDLPEEAKEDLGELLDDARSAAEDGAQLTARLLAFSRKQKLAPTLCDPNDLISGFERLLRRTLGAGVAFSMELAEAIPEVSIDSNQLENALLNLCLNARDAMPNGGSVIVSTSLRRIGSGDEADTLGADPGDYVSVSVSDTGTGIAPENLSRVIEPFFTTKATGEGSGLGLSMIQGFVAQSGGAMEIASELEKGTTISMLFPVAPSDVVAQPKQTIRPAEVSEGTETILVVEDEPRVRRFAIRALSGLGYRVLEAANAQQALDVLGEGVSVDLMFSDIVMPGGVNGRELADVVAKSHPDVKVLLTTGYSKDGVATKPREDFADAASLPLLRKPYSKDQLARQLRELLDAESS